MELGETGLQEQPFRIHGEPLVFFPYAAQQAALEFLTDTCKKDRGLGLFQGPPLSGKTSIIRDFVGSLNGGAAVAVVDGAGLNTTGFLEAILSQFGYDLHFDSVNELMNMLRVVALQQTASGRAPILILENTHALNPSVLQILCELAALKVRAKSALHLILASDRSISSIVSAPAMGAMSVRLTGDFHLEPLTPRESAEYLHVKLRSGGCYEPLEILPMDICDELHVASGGLPGVLDQLVMKALENAKRCPIGKKYIERSLLTNGKVVANGKPALVEDDDEVVSTDIGKDISKSDGAESDGPAKLFLTYNGRTLREIEMTRPRLLLGRSDHNDISVNSRFISRHHAMFVRHGATTFLMDLNSTNGTYINSQRVSNHVLLHNDVISIGNHGIKFHDPNACDSIKLDGAGFDDTVIMKSLQDMRKLLARENTQAMPIASGENLLSGDSDLHDAT